MTAGRKVTTDRYATQGLRVHGEELEPMVEIALPTIELPNILKHYVQQLGDYSSDVSP